MTDLAATANVPTASASRYLQQLCKHWAHNLAVTFDAREGRIVAAYDVFEANQPAPQHRGGR